jgi:hypothetical protein
MKLKKAVLFIFFSFLCNVQAQEYFPGGVTGAEAWYIIDYNDLTNTIYPNHALDFIKIDACQDMGAKSLFNFNHSVMTEGLCLYYRAPLESSTSRNVFFVGEVEETGLNYSHMTTEWAFSPPVNNPIRNRFDLSTKMAYVDNSATNHESVGNANINFYNWYIYQTDKKFKSYGRAGETSFYIGRSYNNQITVDNQVIESQADYFKGNFPEFISFPFELTANEKNRVESYLALKYGITLNSSTSYKDSNNTVFWKSVNANIFPYHIFGIGRDKISSLNQLQSQSVHKKDYLVASVLELAGTNKEKQQNIDLKDNHFIVFGNNYEDATGMGAANDLNVHFLKRIWLSQNTGAYAETFPMYFKINLAEGLKDALLQDPELKLWMLHDKYVNNLELSDFNGNYVDYYEPASMDGLSYAYFEEVFFDTDRGIYDQFTFGVGPEMIVQTRFSTASCDAEQVKLEILITGGQAPYKVDVFGPGGTQNYITSENSVTFLADTSYDYTGVVYDDNGLNETFIANVYLTSPTLSIDLGPDIVLTATSPDVIIDATTSNNDPELTYRWYKDGELLDGEYESVLYVAQPGEYTVYITAGNRICEVSDSIIVYYDFVGAVQAGSNCGETSGSITLTISGGTPPFTTQTTGSGQTVNQVHNSESFVFNQIVFGNHVVKTTDATGEVYQEAIYVQDPQQGMALNLLSQLQQICTIYTYEYLDYPLVDCFADFSLNAGALVTNPNVTYEWFLNGQSLNIYTPVLNLTSTIGDGGTKIYMVKITNTDSACFLTETFGIKGPWFPQQSMSNIADNENNNNPSESNDNKAGIVTKVYPNPSNPNETFYYEITNSEVFEGTVQIYSPTGALILEEQIVGQSSYTLPFSLLASGVYFVCTKTNGNIITDKIIIK